MPSIARALAARFVLLVPLVAFVGGIGCSPAADGPGVVDGANAGSMPADAGGTLAFDASMAPPADDGAAHVVGASPPILTATFLTIETSQYLSAPASGGGPLVANGAPAGPNEAFVLTDLTGAVLTAGDEIQIATSADEVLSAADGGGGALNFAAVAPGADETFIIVHVDGGPGAIESGDEVALQTKVTGNYVSAIDGGGGEVLANAPWDRAWETYTITLSSGGDGDAGASADDAAVSARSKVMGFLTSIRGKQSAIGVEDKDSTNPAADSNTMASMSGDAGSPSFWSADWGFGSGAQPSERESIVQEGIAQWGQGALVQFIYHACPLSWGSDEQGCAYQGGTDPIDGSYGDLTDAQWTDLTTAGGTLNGVWLARLDTLATYFQELKDAGVAPLFRPLHEINGQWAWWQGRPGPTGSLLLYQITHDYLVNAKGLDNIVWVWNVQDYSTLASDVTVYNPGASYFDIAALDVYDGGYTTGNYTAMVGAAAGKPIGVAECEFLPDPGTLASQPLWTYVAMWPDFFSDDTTLIPELFADPKVLTLSAMPGWH